MEDYAITLKGSTSLKYCVLHRAPKAIIMERVVEEERDFLSPDLPKIIVVQDLLHNGDGKLPLMVVSHYNRRETLEAISSFDDSKAERSLSVVPVEAPFQTWFVCHDSHDSAIRGHGSGHGYQALHRKVISPAHLLHEVRLGLHGRRFGEDFGSEWSEVEARARILEVHLQRR